MTLENIWHVAATISQTVLCPSEEECSKVATGNRTETPKTAKMEQVNY